MAAEQGSLVLRIEEPTNPTVGWLGETLLSLEYAYNVAGIIAWSEAQSISPDAMRAYGAILHEASGAGFFSSNFAVRSLLPVDAQLHVHEIHTGESIKLSLNGLADVIQALRECFDREERRHRKVMHQNKEAQAHLDLTLKGIEGFDKVLRRSLRTLEELTRFFGEERAKEIMQLYVSEVNRAIANVDKNEIQAMEGPRSEN